MRTLRFSLIAFLAGTHGFALFVPYLTVTVTIFHLIWANRRRKQRALLRRSDAAKLARRLQPDRTARDRSDFESVGSLALG